MGALSTMSKLELLSHVPPARARETLFGRLDALIQRVAAPPEELTDLLGPELSQEFSQWAEKSSPRGK